MIAGTVLFPDGEVSSDGEALPGPLFDGRLDNAAELARELGLPEAEPGALLETRPEAVLAAGYSRWGRGLLERLQGDFAFVLWDAERRRLFGGRDAVGQRPLYWRRTPGGVAFATALRPLAGGPLDREAAASFLVCGGYGAGATLYSEVRSVPAGHGLVLDPEGARLFRWWRPEELPEDRSLTRVEVARRLEALVREAVACRLPASGPVGVHLSGGLDSSALACLALEDRPVVGLSAVLPPDHPGPERDESEWVDRLQAARPDLEVVRVPVRGGAFDTVDRWAGRLARPCSFHNTYVLDALAEAAEARGLPVVLSGFGGDFTLSYRGTGVPGALLRQGRLGAAWSSARALRSFGLKSLLVRELLAPLVPAAWWDLLETWRGRNRPILRPGLPRPRGLPTPGQIATATPRERMLLPFGPGGLGFVLADLREGPGPEVRHPLLDRRVVEFMVTVPADLLVEEGWKRSPMRRVMQGVLPPEIAWRPCKGRPLDAAMAARLRAARAEALDWLERHPGNPVWELVDRRRLEEQVGLPGAQGALRGYLLARFLAGEEGGPHPPNPPG